MCYAYVPSTYQLIKHDKVSRGDFMMRVFYIEPAIGYTQPNFTGNEENFGLIYIAPGFDYYLLHGWGMWTAWTLSLF